MNSASGIDDGEWSVAEEHVCGVRGKQDNFRGRLQSRGKPHGALTGANLRPLGQVARRHPRPPPMRSSHDADDPHGAESDVDDRQNTGAGCPGLLADEEVGSIASKAQRR